MVHVKHVCLFVAALGFCWGSPARSQISTDVVKIGVLSDMSSVYSSDTGKGSVTAAQLAVEDFGGHIAGKPIQIISADHQNKADLGAAIARQWLDVEQVDAIVDVPNSSVALAVQEIVKSKNRVLLISGGGTSELTGKACSPNGIHWTYDTFALSKTIVEALVPTGKKSWFFISADYTFGKTLEEDASAEVKRLGGTVVGRVRHPLNTPDFASYLLQAQASGAQVIALANAGDDTSNAIKQAQEFGLTSGGQILAVMLDDLHALRSLGQQSSAGLYVVAAWYWDLDERSRAFAQRFKAREGSMPGFMQAGVYSAVRSYLAAISAAGTDEAAAVLTKMKATPIQDMFAEHGYIRPDGRMVHDMYLMQLKSKEESSGEWDLLKVVSKVPGERAFRALKDSACPLAAN